MSNKTKIVPKLASGLLKAATKISLLKNVSENDQLVAGELLSAGLDILQPVFEKNLEKFINKIDKIPKSQFDESFTRSPEYAYLFSKYFGKMLFEYREEKRKAFANLLIRFALKKESSLSEKETYFILVDQLSLIDFTVLKEVFAMSGNKKEFIPEEDLFNGKLGKVNGLGLQTIENSVRILVGRALVEVDYSKKRLEGETGEYHHITDLGKKFMWFIAEAEIK